MIRSLSISKLFLCVLALGLLGGASFAASSNLVETTVAEDHLACIDRADAGRLLHFTRSDEFPSLEALQTGLEKSGRCVWWRKGDQVRVSQFENGDGVTVAAQRPPETKFLFFDRCHLEGLCK
jgi:hypothetical protein